MGWLLIEEGIIESLSSRLEAIFGRDSYFQRSHNKSHFQVHYTMIIRCSVSSTSPCGPQPTEISCRKCGSVAIG